MKRVIIALLLVAALISASGMAIACEPGQEQNMNCMDGCCCCDYCCDGGCGCGEQNAEQNAEQNMGA
jgi:hypothetical protein